MIQQAGNSERGIAPNWRSTREAFQHLVLIALMAGVILFLLCVILLNAPFAIVPVVARVSVTVTLVAMWSVLGPGTYLQRNFWAHLVGAIPPTSIRCRENDFEIDHQPVTGFLMPGPRAETNTITATVCGEAD